MDATDESSALDEGWIQWFCSLDGHRFLCEVDKDYILDSFNLYGLRAKVDNYDGALDMILGMELPEAEELFEPKTLDVYSCAIELYTLIHCRFIFTNYGLSLMNEKYAGGKFGVCPRVRCSEQRALPIGRSDQLKTHRVQLYCPSCQECFESKCNPLFWTKTPSFSLRFVSTS